MGKTMKRLRILSSLLAVGLLATVASLPAAAEVVTVGDEAPTVTIDVPAAFQTSKTGRGMKAKTADDSTWIWFEMYAPEDRDSVVKEHNDYWASNGVDVGTDINRSEQSAGGKTVVATDYKSATWKGKPTVLRYLFIDPGLPSKKLILMSLWASPEGDKAHDAEVMAMIGSMNVRE